MISRNDLLTAAIIGAVLYGGWSIAAATYRTQHCVQLFGHWITVTANAPAWGRAFCQ